MLLNQEQRDMALLGKCPFCERPVRGWKAPEGSFAPEAWATLREHNIDPSSGHLQSCKHKDIRLPNGFTLIELCIVVVIVGILAAIAIPNFMALQDNARCASVKANMHVLQCAAEDFATFSEGQYPETAEAAMQDGKPLVNPFGGDVAMETASAPSPVSGVVSYGYGSATIIGGGLPGGLIGWRDAPNAYRIGGYGKSAPLALVLTQGGEQ